MVHHVRVIALAAVLIGSTALVPSTRLHAQQPLDELRALAEQGNAEAQFNLAYRYVAGRGVPQDGAEAVRWWRAAADQGHAGSRVAIAVMYSGGLLGVTQDEAEAVRWFRLAADQGKATAQRYLGFMYADGDGVPQDDVTAYMWLDLAASGLHPDARRQERGKRLDLLRGRMTLKQLAEAQRRVRGWTPTPEP